MDPATSMLSNCFGDFLGSDPDGFQYLREQFEETVFDPGHVLWHAHEPATFCVGVVDGCLHSLQPQASEGNGHVVMEVLNVGGFVGFSGLLNQLPYSQDVVVPSDGTPC